MEELVSIIVPIYNNDMYLTECIDSILAQTYQNIEIILVDDGSSDNSLVVCKEYEMKDTRIKTLSQRNRGVSAARNQGLKSAKGDYLCFVDGDDTIHKDMIKDMLYRIKADKSDICALNDYSIVERKKETEILIAKEYLSRLCLLQVPSSVWAYMYKREKVLDVTFNEDIHYFEDFLFNINVIKKSGEVSLLSGAYYNYRINPNGANGSQFNSKKKTCMSIYELAYEDCSMLSCTNELLFFKAHCYISIVLAMARSQQCMIKEYEEMCHIAKKMFLNIIKNKFIPCQYKMIIMASAIDVKAICRVAKWIKKY